MSPNLHVDRGNLSSCLQSWSDLRVWLSRVQPVCSEFRVSRLDSLHFNSDFLDHHKVNTDANWFGHIVYTCFYLVGFILVDGADVSAALINQKKKALSLPFPAILFNYLTASNTSKIFLI